MKGNAEPSLPASWCSVLLGDALAEPMANGRSVPTAESGFPVLRLTALRDGRVDLAERKVGAWTAEVARPYLVSAGDILVSRGNGSLSLVGRAGLVGPIADPVAFPDTLIRVRADERVLDARFFVCLWNASIVRDQLERFAKTTAGIFKVSQGDLARVRLAVPPLNEQRRIVAKLEALQSRSRRAREALDAVPRLLEKLRQSILAAAFRGDLTKDWRAKQKDVEPATELLARIRTERRRKWEENELARMKAKGKAPADDRWKGRYEEPEGIASAGLPELPETWCWASLGELLSAIDAGRSPKAQGRPAEEGEQGVLKVSAVSWENFEARENKALIPGEVIGDAPTVRAGDLLISRANTVQLVGAVVLVEEDHPNLMLSDKTLRLVPACGSIPPRFLLNALRTRAVRTVFEDDATGTSDSMRNLSQEKIRRAPIPLPPQAEAELIASRLQAALEQRGRGLSYLSELRASIDSLDRALLAKAFRGGLVPQDPSDEPADAMLARLRAKEPDAPDNRAFPKPRGIGFAST